MATYLHPTGHFDRSRWRRRSNEVIRSVFAENAELVEDPTRHTFDGSGASKFAIHAKKQGRWKRQQSLLVEVPQ